MEQEQHCDLMTPPQVFWSLPSLSLPCVAGCPADDVRQVTAQGTEHLQGPQLQCWKCMVHIRAQAHDLTAQVRPLAAGKEKSQ